MTYIREKNRDYQNKWYHEKRKNDPAYSEKKKAYDKEYKAKNRDRQNEYKKAWKEANKEKHTEYMRKYSKEWSLRNKYGLSIEQYSEMIETQDNRCIICEQEFGEEKRPCVDHCHKTGRVRGILCDSCNTSLGGFRDSPELLIRAINYLS